MELSNRFVRSAAFEGMCPGGIPSRDLVDYHASVAAGGAGMTTVAYASVSGDGLTYPHQICFEQPDIVTHLRKIADAVHAEGGAACIQIGHAGYFASKAVIGCRPLGASRVFNTYGLTMPVPMTVSDMSRIAADFARATTMALGAGFDAIEVQSGHGYLLSQFLSPYTNRRTDQYGGTLENRLRFPLQVIRRVREAAGEHPVVVKMNLRDGFEGGMELDESVEVARALEVEGVDALVLSGGFVSKVPMYVMRGDVPFKEMYEGQTQFTKKAGLLLLGKVMVKGFPFSEAYFLDDALKVREAVTMPLMLVGGMRSLAKMSEVLDRGFELIAMARPLIIQPDFINRLRAGEVATSVCEPCNRCIASMDKGDMVCTERQRLTGR